jgi:hypothetical protein
MGIHFLMEVVFTDMAAIHICCTMSCVSCICLAHLFDSCPADLGHHNPRPAKQEPGVHAAVRICCAGPGSCAVAASGRPVQPAAVRVRLADSLAQGWAALHTSRQQGSVAGAEGSAGHTAHTTQVGGVCCVLAGKPCLVVFPSVRD